MSELERETDRLREAFAAERHAADGGTNCPQPPTLFRAAAGDLGRTDTNAVVDHLAVCGSCREAWRLAVEVADLPAETRSRNTAPVILAAAAAVIVVAGVVVYRATGTAVDDTYRGDENSTAVVVTEVAGLSRTAFELAWTTPKVDAESYDIRVYNEALDLLSETRGLAAPRYLVPIEDLAGVAAGQTVFWQVDVHVSGGRRIQSATVSTRVLD